MKKIEVSLLSANKRNEALDVKRSMVSEYISKATGQLTIGKPISLSVLQRD